MSVMSPEAPATAEPIAAAGLMERVSEQVSPAPSTHRWRGRLFRLLGIVLSIGLAVITASRVDLSDAVSNAEAVALPLLVGCLLLNVPASWLRAIRSQQILASVGPRIGVVSMAIVQLAGQTASWVTPGSVGDAVRAYIWRSRNGVRLTTGLSTVIYERVWSLGLMVAAAGAYLLPHVIGRWGFVLGVLGLIGAVAAPTIGHFVAVWLHIEERLLQTRRFGGFSSLFKFMASWRLTLLFAGLTLGIFLLSGLQISMLTLGVGGSVGVLGAAGIYAASQAAGSLSSLPFGLGVADATAGTLLVLAGVHPAAAAAVAVLLRLTVTLPLGLAGAATYAAVIRQPRDDPATD